MVKNDLIVEFSLELDFEERIGWRWAGQDSFTLSLLQPTFTRHLPCAEHCIRFWGHSRGGCGGGGRQAPLGGLNCKGGKDGNSGVRGGYSWLWKTIKKQDLSDSDENRMEWYEGVGQSSFWCGGLAQKAVSHVTTGEWQGQEPGAGPCGPCSACLRSNHSSLARAHEHREVGGEGQSNGKPLEGDTMCFTLLKCYSGGSVGKDYKGTRAEEGRWNRTQSLLSRDIQ